MAVKLEHEQKYIIYEYEY